MAAAPDYLLHASRETSPELALVDATLAAELRQTLRLPSEIHVRPQLVAVEDTPLPSGSVDDLIVEPTDDLIVEPTDDLIVDPTEDHVPPAVSDAPEPLLPAAGPAAELIIFPDDTPLAATVSVEVEDDLRPPADDAEAEESDDARSDYPVLPALDTRSTEETDAVLRRIREQIATVEPRASRRRVRRSFVVASGLAAVCALAAVVTEIQLGLVPVF
jgi:hypothetical protein